MKKKTPIEKIHKKRKRGFKIIIFIGLLSLFVFFVLNSTFFHIKEININNNKNLKKEDLLKESGLRKNTNIFKFKRSNIEENLNKNPFIKSVQLKRELPDKVNINIKERNKTFLFQYISMYLVVDEEGFIIEHLESTDENLPTVKGFNTELTETGENIFLKEENKNLKTFINEAKSVNILTEIEEIDKDFANDVNIKFKNGIFVAFGTLNNVKYKLSLLKEILKDIDEKEIKAKKIIMNKGSHPILILND